MSIPTVKDCGNCFHCDDACQDCICAEATGTDAPSEWKPNELYMETDTRCTECEAGHTARITALEASLAAARAELERRKPEERVGECFCEPTSSRLRWLQHGRSFVCVEPCWINEDTDDTYPPGCFCPDCGAELGDGTARRNADTARVARVRDALGMLEPADDLTECGDQTYYNGVWAAIEAVGAALDPPGDPEVGGDE
jgi:hypothetical protein